MRARGKGGRSAAFTSSATTMRTNRRISAWLALGVLVLGLQEVPGIGNSDTTEEDLSSVLCVEDGTNAHYEEFLSGLGRTKTRWSGSVTGCPNHVHWAINPNDATHNPTNTSIPAYPMLIGAGGTRDLSSARNTIGIMRNGVSLFSAWAVNTVTTFETTAFSLESSTFDMCGGHATAMGIYHYHSTPGCLQEQAMREAGRNASQHSPLLGWSYDGFPVYGQLGSGGVEMKMCGENRADERHCLDVCNGYEAELPSIDSFKYRYYLSCGFDESYFPLTINCYRGCCPDGMTCSTKLKLCDENAVEGYTADYVPEAYPSLATAYDADLIEGNDTLRIEGKNVFDCALYAANVTLGATPAPSAVTSTDGGAPFAPTAAPLFSPSTAPVALEAATLSPETTATSVASPAPSVVDDSKVNTTQAPSTSWDKDRRSGAIPRSSKSLLGMLLSMAVCIAIFVMYEVPGFF